MNTIKIIYSLIFKIFIFEKILFLHTDNFNK